jgi:O-methyltransferase
VEGYLSRWTDDKDFINLCHRFNAITGLTNSFDNALYARLYILRQLAMQQKNIGADWAECGVYAGMSMFFVADIAPVSFIGIDSFEGVSEPKEFDTEYFKKVKLQIPIEPALNNLSEFNNVKLHKGWIPEIFNDLKKTTYSYVHIDVDLYEPTKDCIEYFYPKMVSGGVMICDDYGSYKTIGARKAFLDFFGKDSILELPTGQAIVYK